MVKESLKKGSYVTRLWQEISCPKLRCFKTFSSYTENLY